MIARVDIDTTTPVIRERLLSWSAKHYRDLPWRRSHEAYRILVAEVLLKRTTATAVSNVYNGFLQKYPTLHHLAKASGQALAEDLRPLGLHYQRAKAITRLVGYVELEENGKIPDSLERLLKVPGLGEYSARAILSFAYGHPCAVMDSNFARIFRRVYQNRVSQRLPKAKLQTAADNLLPAERHREFNFALLDLGSSICRPSAPRCKSCPLESLCDFARLSPKKQTSMLRAIRKSKGFSLISLSQTSGLSKTALINIEMGRTKPRQESIRKLAKVLGVDPAVIDEQSGQEARNSEPDSI